MSVGIVAAVPQRVLTIRFQGICAFLRNHQALANTTEVTVLFVAGEQANENPKLCAHSPVLVFQASEFLRSTGQVSHTTALIPGPGIPNPALGLWPLAGKDLRISGAPAASLTLDSSFGKTTDLGQLLPSGKGVVSAHCLDPQPPADLLVSSRMFLTSGRLLASAFIGDSGQQDDQWVFDDEVAQPTSGTPVIFSQEIQYDFFSSTPTQTVVLEAGPLGSPANETLALTAGARVAVSQLCPIDLKPIDDERDFLAYYALLANKVSPRLIPHRIRQNGTGIRIGVSACPPATTYI